MPAPLRVYFLYEFSLETVRMPNLDAAIQVVGLRPYLNIEGCAICTN